ncbi:uncharacterized protein LOC134439939 [Engraulis encrasicolus]|uniref:uncharacterized protein LOC134439939 n=1 Tax=Engraulis encrasicolus TaxID=184585 RepID=UPI002FD6B969
MRSDISKDNPPNLKELQPEPSAVKKRPGSPTPSCVSMRSDQSMDEPLRFKAPKPPPELSVTEKRSESPTPSCVSMRSDISKDNPPNLKELQPELRALQKRPESPTPSCVSMRSGQSMDEPLRFKVPTLTLELSTMEKRPRSPTSSCVSMRSDQSMDEPLRFKEAALPPELRAIEALEAELPYELSDMMRSVSPTPSCASMRSDISKYSEQSQSRRKESEGMKNLAEKKKFHEDLVNIFRV